MEIITVIIKRVINLNEHYQHLELILHMNFCGTGVQSNMAAVTDLDLAPFH